MERSDSVVGSGVVHVAKVRSRGDSLGGGRTKSWSGEQGLVAVPEGPEEDDREEEDRWSGSQASRGSAAGAGRGQREEEEDRVGLLSPHGEARDLTGR